MGSFERFLQTIEVDLDFLLPDLFAQVFCEFYLNPRYLRGSDFLMRFSQGRWAEDIVGRTINATDDLHRVENQFQRPYLRLPRALRRGVLHLAARCP